MKKRSLEINRRNFLKSTAAGLALGAAPLAEAARKHSDPQGLLMDEQPHRDLSPADFAIARGNPFEGSVRCRGHGIAGVAVTNGRDSVKTDKNGNYHLPVWNETRFISVTIPSGYTCRHWFYDAWARFEEHGFNLTECPKLRSGGCKFIQIADSEIKAPEHGAEFVRNLKALGDREQVAFYVHTGDICGNLGMKAHFQIMSDYTMGRPTFYCLGNHDMVSTWPYGEAEFESLFGPSWHSFDVGGIHFVVTPMNATQGDRVGGFDEDMVADWLRGDLALVEKSTPVIFFNHYFCSSHRADWHGRFYGMRRPLELAKVCNFKGWIYGHAHNTWKYQRDGVVYFNTSNPNQGGIDHSPNIARVFTVTAAGEITSASHFGNFAGFKPKAVKAKWETKLAAGVLHGGMLDGGKLLYVSSHDDDNLGTAYLYAIEKASGKVVWKTRLVNTVKGTWALASGLVIGMDVESNVCAYESATGKLVWTRNLLESAMSKYFDMLGHGVVASPDGSRVAAGVGRCQHVLDAKTSAVIWKDGGAPERCGVAVTPALTDKYLLTPYNWGPFVCSDVASGKELWRFGSFNFPGAQPKVLGSSVLLSDKSFIAEFDLASGKELQRTEEVPWPKGRRYGCPGDMLVTDELVLKGAVNSGLVALDRRNLKRIVWSAPVGEGLCASSEYGDPKWRTLNTTPVRYGSDQVCAAAIDGKIHFWNLKDGKEVRTIDTGIPFLASVLVDGESVIAADLLGQVRCF